MSPRRVFTLAVVLGCACDPSPAQTMDSAMDDADDAMAAAACPGAGGELDDGEPCTSNVDCASGVCAIHTDAPINADAVCVDTPKECATHFTGTVLDFATGAPVPGVVVNLTTAGAAVADARNAPTFLQLRADDAGRYEGTSPGPIVDAPLAVLALAWSDTHLLSASGLAQPAPGSSEYEVGAGLHEVWVVPVDLLGGWSEALVADEEIDPAWLPLSQVGAIVGRVRDGTTGEPIAGARVVSIDGGNAIVRYVAEDGTLTSDATGPSGNFLLFGTAPVETFAAFSGDVEVGRATLGVVPGAMFVTILQSVP